MSASGNLVHISSHTEAFALPNDSDGSAIVFQGLIDAQKQTWAQIDIQVVKGNILQLQESHFWVRQTKVAACHAI